MTGHQSIVELRLHHHKPAEAWVILHDRERPTFGSFTQPETLMHNQSAPEVHVMPEEVVGTLDFRFLRGVLVHIVGLDKDRCIAAVNRVAQFEPAKAITAGQDWLLGWKPGIGFIDLLRKQ